MREYLGDDPVSFVVSLNLKRRHLDEAQRSLVAARIENLKHGQTKAEMPIGISRSEAAAMLNVGERSVARGREVLDKGAPELVSAVERGQVSVSAAADVASLPVEKSPRANGWAGELPGAD